MWVRRGYVHSARARTRRERKKEKNGKRVVEKPSKRPTNWSGSVVESAAEVGL